MTDKHVLFVGFDPARMNLDEAPVGTAAQIQDGIDRSMQALEAAGYIATFCPLAEEGEDAEQIVRAQLQTRSFDCVVIGAGVRLLVKHTALFEALVNAVVEAAPGAKLAFNATPGDAADAVDRQLRG